MSTPENILHAARAAKAIEAYDDNPNKPLETKIVDLLTDLLHLADRYIDDGAGRVLRIAKGYFDEEVAGNE